MAIKGKKKSRGRPRAVAAAPRPFLVPPKTPLFRRKGVQLLLIILLEAVIAAFALGYRISRDNAQMRSAVQEFGTRVDAHLQGGGVGQPVPGAVLVLPQMAQSIAALRSGQAAPADIGEQARAWQKAAEQAEDQISSLEAEEPALKAARLAMAQGLEVYASVAANLQVATELEGREQKQLLDNLGTELQTAAEIFDTGYQILQDERRKVDLLESTAGVPPGLPPGGVPGLPPGGGIPGLPPGGG